MPTPFEISSRLIDHLAELSPLFATTIGTGERDGEWDDLSPDGYEARVDLVRTLKSDLVEHLDHPDPDQRLAAHVNTEYADYRIDEFEAHDHLRDLAHLSSTFQTFREIFEYTDPVDDRSASDAARRLATISEPLSEYQETLRGGMAIGEVASIRQVESVHAQAVSLTCQDSAWHLLERGSPIPDRMSEAIVSAKRAMSEFAGFLEHEYLPRAGTDDGVGRARYRRSARSFLGMDIDADELYEWGWGEIDRLLVEMRSVAKSIDPQLDLTSAVERMETDEGLAIVGAGDFVEFIERRQRRAIADLDRTHFDLTDDIRRFTVSIAPPGGALGAYYRPPSENFARPGGIYYSIGDRRTFPLYQEVSTAYHEGFPGHHLQIATAMAAGDRLSRSQRVLIWYSGYGEGWAMYAERLMHELGYFERPEWVFGMLASHLFRAARVVTDIGLHLGLTIPQGGPMSGVERWDFDVAVRFMIEIGLQPPEYSHSEVLRYLGWPGQAISYKIGEREILDLRNAEQTRLGNGFDLKQFHSTVLGSGEMGFDLLRRVVAGDFDS